MTTDIHCPKCGGHFDSSESYQNHLPCHDSTVGGSGDLRETQEEYIAKDDTGER